MRKIYLSFLGANKYTPAVYSLNNKKASKTEYVQCAEIELLGTNYFDIHYIVVTQTSKKMHIESLKKNLEKLGVDNFAVIEITEELEAKHQWTWFEEILSKINQNDCLTVDMTHGFRIIPIIFATAINFLQKAKGITLEAVYYGAFEKDKDLSPIIDMKDFYIINEWADAVGRLIDDANADKLAFLSENTSGEKFAELNDPQIINALNDLTKTVKNIDIQNIGAKADKALSLIKKKASSTKESSSILLKLVIDKFVSLTTEEPLSGNYDLDYFKMQLEIIKLLLNHKLFMQAYTVMREFIGSIGIIEIKKSKTNTAKGRKQRKKADVFVNMLVYKEDEWKFKPEEIQKIMPLYNKIKSNGIENKLRNFCNELTDYRNGFDHAWTGKAGQFEDIEEKGYFFYEQLKEIINKLENEKILAN
jgi:hypothetical protein